MPLTVAEFVIRWKTHDQSEEAGAKPHFLDLCDLLGQPHPAAADSAGENYAFEKRIRKTAEPKDSPTSGTAITLPGNTRRSASLHPAQR